MNKVYITVWCASRGMWVVTSELVRKGGQRPRQIRKTVLAGLIAGLLAPQAPVLAQTYDNQTLQNSSVTLNNGDTATNTTLNLGGELNISSGGSATSSVVSNGGRENVHDGGVATGTIINGGTRFDTTAQHISDVGQIVYSGGSAANTVVNRGAQVVSGGTVTSATINKDTAQYVADGGVVSGVVIHGAQWIVSLDPADDKAEVKGASVEKGGYQHIGLGTTTDTILNGGDQFVDGGGATAIRTTVNSGGLQTIDLFGHAQNTVINSLGKQLIIDLGKASDTEVNDGGIQTVGMEGSATGTVINSGGQQFLNDHDRDDNPPAPGWPVTKGGHASDTVINDGGIQHVQSTGSASDTTVNSGGVQNVSSGGSATGTTIDGGIQYVLDGGSVSDTTVNSGGVQDVSSGGSATGTTINSRGQQVISSGGSATDAVINAGGVQNISGGSVTSTTINGDMQTSGVQNVLDGGSASDTTVNSGGEQNVLSGGRATDTVINSSGGLRVLDGGNATNITLNNNGTLHVGSGASATAITQNSGGAVQTNTSAVLEGSNRNGSFSITGGSASNMLLENGGFLDVLNTHQAVNTTVEQLGNLYVSSGGHASETTLRGFMLLTGGDATNTVVNSDGSMSLEKGAHASNTTVNSGGRQQLNDDSAASNTTLNGGVQHVQVNASVIDTIINSGGNQYLYGASATSTIINSGAQWGFLGSATDTVVNTGGTQYLYGASATNTTINGGIQYVVENQLPGNNQEQGSATDTTINAGGKQHVYGGSVTSTSINEGGVQELLARGSATDTTVNSGGTQYVYGGSAVKTTLNGGVQHVMVYPHPLTSAPTSGAAADTIINTGGSQIVSSGGSASSTTINDAGTQHVLLDGETSDTTLNSGGTLKVDAGGTATAITQNDGGAVVTNTSAVLEGINRNGSFGISGGSAANMLLENGGILEVYDTHEATDTWVDRGGTLLLNSGSVLKGATTITGDGTLSGPGVNNQGHLRYLNNSAAVYSGNITGTGDLTVEGGSLTLNGTLSQNGGVFISSGGLLNMESLQTQVDVIAQSGTTLNLMNGSTLTGRILDDGTGGGDVSVAGPSVWRLTGDSGVGALSLSGGTIDFHAVTSLPLSATTLTAGSLSGTGTFLMNTDIAAWSGDLLNVTGNASGNFNLGIKNTGEEPVSAGEPLRVVHTGGGDAQFTLNGGKVDAGAWEYYLTRESTDWYLTPDIPTASTDAVLSMASAPVYIFNQELQNLRFRRGDVVQNSPTPGGVWGRYIGSDTRISGAAGSGYKLRQSGIETGGDKVFDLGDSRLAVGAFFSFTDNRISHARGGSSDVDSTGGGLYATWADNSGLYVDGVAKVNHFSNRLQTQMSDSTSVRGNYSQNGYGVSLEVGKTFRLSENVWAEPYVLGRAFSAEGRDIRLDNGMKARIDTTKSLQAEAGVSVGMNLDVGGTVVKPYLSAAVSHEFSDNNKVRINDSYDFRNDISGTTGKYGLGVSAQLTPNAGVWAEARYENGRHTESPVTASVGFRINF